MITITDSFMLVSKTCVDILRQFRLGKTRLIPLPLYETGTEELLSNELWYLLELSEWRSYFIPELSNPLCKPLNYKYDKGNYQNHKILNRFRATDGDYAMSVASNQCDLDLWHEPQLDRSICFSDALKTALEKAGMADKLHFQSCKLVD